MNFRKIAQRRQINRVEPVWGRMRIRKHELTASNKSGRSDKNQQIATLPLSINCLTKEQRMNEENISHQRLDRRANPLWENYEALIEQAVLFQDVYCVHDLNPKMEKALFISAIKENKIFLSEGYSLRYLIDKDIESAWNKFYGEAA